MTRRTMDMIAALLRTPTGISIPRYAQTRGIPLRTAYDDLARIKAAGYRVEKVGYKRRIVRRR